MLNGVQLFYSIRGTGPVLIAHCGGPGLDPRCWQGFSGIEDFATIVILHPRGSGLSAPAPSDAYYLSDYASDLEALRIHLELDAPIILGWSHGGMVAMNFALNYPNSLCKMVLVSTGARINEELRNIEESLRYFRNQPWYQESLDALKKSWASAQQSEAESRKLWEKASKFYFAHFDERALEYIKTTNRYRFADVPQKVFFEKELPTTDLRPRLPEIKVPTLVTVGRYDFLTPVIMAKEIVVLIANARLEVFESSGHYIFVEERERYCSILREFISNQ